MERVHQHQFHLMRLGGLVGLVPLLGFLLLWQIAVAAHLYPPVLLPPPGQGGGSVRALWTGDCGQHAGECYPRADRHRPGILRGGAVGLVDRALSGAGPAVRLVDPNLPLGAADLPDPDGHAVLRHRRHPGHRADLPVRPVAAAVEHHLRRALASSARC